MPLHLIHGPPNSGRAELIRRGFLDALAREPILVVPNMDDVFSFERELCRSEILLGGSVMTFGGLFRTIVTAAGSPPGPELTPAQRLRVVSIAIRERQRALGPLRRSAAHPGFAVALERFLGELQADGVRPERIASGAETLESSAYLEDLGRLFEGYVEVRERLLRTDQHAVARRAIESLRSAPEPWAGRPLFIYGLDDLTGNQFELIGALAAVTEVTMALPFEQGRAALAAREDVLERLRREIGAQRETATEPQPEHTPNPFLFRLERQFGVLEAEPEPPGKGLKLLRSAGERGEAEAIGTEVAKLIAAGADPSEIAIVARDPARRGPMIASILDSYSIAAALEAELPVSGTSVGGALIALLEAEFGAQRAADLLRYMRGPSGIRPGRVDWLERSVRRARVQTAAGALELWQGEAGEPPFDIERLRRAARESAGQLVREVAALAGTMASRPLRGKGDGPPPGPGDGLELRAAAAISSALVELAELGRHAPRPNELVEVLQGIQFRVWSGPVEGRVRIASPYRLRAGRFEHVFIASLQDGEFPRRDRGADPFLSEPQREALGLAPRRDTEAEERYLFYTCLSLPRKSLFLSYRDSDDDGAAEPRSPLLDDLRRLLAPAPEDGRDRVEESILGGRDLARTTHPVTEAPSENELARAIVAHGGSQYPAVMLGTAKAPREVAKRVKERIAAARRAEAAGREPGPLASPAVIDSLAAVPAYGGTTLEQFDVCSYRWFAGHELDPQPLDPTPEPLTQGKLMHSTLERLYREQPQGTPLPLPSSLEAWSARGCELVREVAVELELDSHPASRALVRRVERLLLRFLGEEAKRTPQGFEPWLLEAVFGESDDSEKPVLEIDDWGLHGAVDRIDRDGKGRALVIDYKVSPGVTPLDKLEEKAKLQLQLYLLAVAEHWGAEPVGGLYYPLRGTSGRRPRGVVLDTAATELESLGLFPNDIVDAAGFEQMLNEARRRAGAIVTRIRSGDIRRDPGPRPGLRGHDVCPPYCEFAPICRRDRSAFAEAESEEGE